MFPQPIKKFQTSLIAFRSEWSDSLLYDLGEISYLANGVFFAAAGTLLWGFNHAYKRPFTTFVNKPERGMKQKVQAANLSKIFRLAVLGDVFVYWSRLVVGVSWRLVFRFTNSTVETVS